MKKRIIFSIITITVIMLLGLIFFISQKDVSDYGLLVKLDVNEEFNTYNDNLIKQNDKVNVTINGTFNRITDKFSGEICIDGFDDGLIIDKYPIKKENGYNKIYYNSILYKDDSTTGVTPEFKYNYELCFTKNFKDCTIIVRDVDNHNIVCIISNIENNIQDVVEDVR